MFTFHKLSLANIQQHIGMKGAGSTNRGGRHDLRAESGVIDGGFFKTKIADIDIVVPIPGQRKKRYA